MASRFGIVLLVAAWLATLPILAAGFFAMATADENGGAFFVACSALAAVVMAAGIGARYILSGAR